MHKKRSTVFPSLRQLTQAAMLTALSVVIGFFCKTYLNFGAGLFRVTFENLPIILSGILYGPVVGAFVGGASDLISYLLSSFGQAYPPNLIVTLGAILVGGLSGLVPLILKRSGYTQIILSGAVAHLVGSMLVKPLGLYQFYGPAVLWRIPLYLIIAPIEILLLCRLLRRKAVQRVTGYKWEGKERL